MGVGMRFEFGVSDCVRIFQGGRRGPGPLKDDGLPALGWEKSAESESSDIIMSTSSSSSALRACGLPGSESMEDWSSLSYLFCWE